jgi:hypothetical protein
MSIIAYELHDMEDRLLTIAATEAGGCHCDLGLVGMWGPESALFNAQISGAVEDGGRVG